VSVKILVVDPIGERGHEKFNKFTLDLLSSFCDIEFLTTEKYSVISDGICKSSIFPISLLDKLDNKYMSRVLLYLRSQYAIDYFWENNFDIIYFLTYETISLSLLSLDKVNIWVHDHNNIDDIQGSKIKTYYFSRLSRKVVHIVYEEYMADFISEKYGGDAYTIPHPSFLDEEAVMYLGGEDDIVFSPSGTYDPQVMDELEMSASKLGFYLWAKSDSDSESEYVIKRRYFDDYEESIKKSSVVFIINNINYRISGVMYEALAYGKTVVGIDSKFLQALEKQYRGLVYIIKDVSDIRIQDFETWIGNDEREESFNNFIHGHSRESVNRAYKNLMSRYV